MKKWVMGLVLLFTLSSLPAFSATPPKPGSTCSKQGITKTYKGKIYTCIKSGKKLVWNKGVVISKSLPSSSSTPTPAPTPTPTPTRIPIPIPIPTPIPTLTPSSTMTPTTTASPSAAGTDIRDPIESLSKDSIVDVSNCKLKDQRIVDSHIATTSGFPLGKDRLKTTGTVKTLFVPIDFNGAEWQKIAYVQLNDFVRSGEDFFKYISNGKMIIESTVFPEVIRLSGSLNSYPIDRTLSRQDYRGIMNEIVAAVELRGFGVGDYDQLVVIPPKDTNIGGLSFPDFAGNSAITSKSGPIYNSSFLGMFFTPMYLFAHEVGHLIGFNHISADISKLPVPLNSGWDIMGGKNGTMSFNGWHKWLANWIDDSQVICVDRNLRTPIKVMLNEINVETNSSKMIIIPLSTSRVIVIESRRRTPFDDQLPKDISVDWTSSNFGVIAYIVDSSKHWEEAIFEAVGDGPVNSYGQKIGIQAPNSFTVDKYKITVLKSSSLGDFVELALKD